MKAQKVMATLPVVKLRRPFRLPANRVHKNKRDLLSNPKHALKELQ